MTTFTLGLKELKQEERSSFDQFISIVKGRSIVSAGDWGNGRFELGLSGGAMVRFFWPEQTDAEVNLIGTINSDEVPPTMISLGNMPQQVPVAMIERKLRGLRALYAIFLLYHTNRLGELYEFIGSNPDGDIEQSLIAPEDALTIESISYGSWVLAVWTKTQASYKAIVSVAGLAFSRGREAFLEKMEAEARLSSARARREEIAAEKDEFELRRNQLDYMLQVSSEAGSPEVRRNLEARMIAATRDLTAGDSADENSYRQLERPRRSGPRLRP